MFNKVFEPVFPGTGLRNALWKVFFANSIGDPVFFFPTFYTMREIVSTGTVSMKCARDGLRKYSENYREDWLNSWSIWIPAHCIKSVIIPAALVEFRAADVSPCGAISLWQVVIGCCICLAPLLVARCVQLWLHARPPTDAVRRQRIIRIRVPSLVY